MNIFLVSSCIKPKVSSISFEDRYKQTLETFESVRKKVPKSFIVFADGSYFDLTEEEKLELQSKVDVFLDLKEDPNIKIFSEYGLKSHGECFLLLKSLEYLCRLHPNIIKSSNRIFKLGGRCKLTDSFDIKEYKNYKGKYVFKKRVPTWMPKEKQLKYNSTHILETRLYSFCSSLVNDYIEVLKKNFQLFEEGFDTEHSHLINIPSEKLVEFEFVHSECIVAGINNSIMID